MRDRQICIGCGKKSPETETNYTLISSQFGWRLTRSVGENGHTLVEWRCPVCWRDYKKARGGTEPRAPSSSREPIADGEPATLPKFASASSSAEDQPPSSVPSPRTSGRPR